MTSVDPEVEAVRARLAAVPQDEVPVEDLKQLEEGMQTLNDIPDEVIDQGDAAVQQWVDEHHPNAVSPGGARAAGFWEVSKCVGGILLAISGAAIPAVKLLQLKKFIKHAGGVREAAFLLIRIAKGQEQVDQLGAVLGGLASEILGINAIRDNCF